MKTKNSTLKTLLFHLSVVIVLTVLIILLFFNVFLPERTSKGKTITVPNLTGLKLNEIREYVGEHLRYEVSDSSFNKAYPPLTILEQYPRAGHKVKQNRLIYLTINRVKPPTVPLPDLVDHSLVNAEAVLQSNELKRGKIIFETSPYRNLVLKMMYEGKEIESGKRVPKGSIIDLIVGNGE